MAFDGEVLDVCIPIQFAAAACVIVTGDRLNPCGHALLWADGHYFHIAEFHGRPKHMDEQGFQRYLSENGKSELGRHRRQLQWPNEAYVKLNELLIKPWLWMMLPNNCIVFVEEVLQAGGATNFGLYSNCPTLQLNKDYWDSMLLEMRRRAYEFGIRQYMMNVPSF